MKILLCLLLILNACSFKSKTDNQKLKGHEELYSEPEAKVEKLDKEERRIVIAATNDLQGNYNPPAISFTDSSNKGEQAIQIGGEEVISQYFQILRDTYKDIVLVDSGNIFASSGALDSVRNFYRKNKYDAVTVGLRDFNLKVPNGTNVKMFEEFAKTSQVPLLLSNLYELKTARVVEWEGVKSYVTKDINGVKVGIIGLVPDDIVEQTPVNNRVGLFVENMLQATLRHARLLRSLGADMIVVITHQSITCGIEQAEEAKLPVSKVNFDPQKESACNLKSPLGVFLERLPPQLVDVVIGGRNEHKMANYINGTLVLGAEGDGKSFSFAEFVVNTKTKKVIPEKSVVHQPVRFCHEFFKETQDCYYEDSSVDHKKRVPAKFLDKDIVPSVNMGTATGKKKVSSDKVSRILKRMGADISYSPIASGETQLFMLPMAGKDLITQLERDYNEGKDAHWLPHPFRVEGEKLHLSIGKTEIDPKKTYKVLMDLESIQKHKRLVKLIHQEKAEAFTELSWSNADTINDRMPSSRHIELSDL